MTDAQFCFVVGVPILANAVMFGLVWAFLHAQFGNIHRRFDSIERRFDAMNRHFGDVRAM